MLAVNMETHTFPIAEQEKRKLDLVQSELRMQPMLTRAQDFMRSNTSWMWTAIALVGMVAGCLVARVFSRR